jgi:hypothetical protein
MGKRFFMETSHEKANAFFCHWLTGRLMAVFVKGS